MDIKEDFQSVVAEWGLINSHPGETRSDNGALWTTEYYLCLKRLGLLSPQDVDTYKLLMNQLILPSGLTVRQPGYMALDSPDNLIAFAVGSKAFGCDFAARILDYGKTTCPRYVYNPANPGKFELSAWMGRQVGLIGFLKYSAGRYVNPFEWLVLYVGIYLASRDEHNNTSDKMLTEIIVEQLPDGIIPGLVKRLWRKHVLKEYGGVNGMVRVFFSASSPFSRWWT